MILHWCHCMSMTDIFCSFTRNFIFNSCFLLSRVRRNNSYIFGPEFPVFETVFQVVPDDVGFLEEQPHGVGEVGVLAHDGILQLGRWKESGETDADQTSNIVAVLKEEDTEIKFCAWKLHNMLFNQLKLPQIRYRDCPPSSPWWCWFSAGTAPWSWPGGCPCLRWHPPAGMLRRVWRDQCQPDQQHSKWQY